MIGGIEETSASFEARSAPRSYPTISNTMRSAVSAQAKCLFRLIFAEMCPCRSPNPPPLAALAGEGAEAPCHVQPRRPRCAGDGELLIASGFPPARFLNVTSAHRA